MKPAIDKERLQQVQQANSMASANMAPATTAGPDPSLASLISQQILTMQKQMERGFGLMADKINLIEGRVENASQQLEMIERTHSES